jgi:hypothetical protein
MTRFKLLLMRIAVWYVTPKAKKVNADEHGQEM